MTPLPVCTAVIWGNFYWKRPGGMLAVRVGAVNSARGTSLLSLNLLLSTAKGLRWERPASILSDFVTSSGSFEKKVKFDLFLVELNVT